MIAKKNGSRGKVVLYKNHLEVLLEEENVWLTQVQIATLFGTKRPAITKHLSNIFKAKELNKDSVCSKMEHTASDGKIYKTQYYNLDAIISVGYRVNSTLATQFRIWATNVLRKHLIEGYSLNEKRLKSQAEKIKNLQEAVSLLKNIPLLENISDEAKGIIKVIQEYSRALEMLDDFDHKRLKVPKGQKKNTYELTYDKASKIIQEMKRYIQGVSATHEFKASLGVA